MEVCFDNREADIGRFLRRHLSGIQPEILKEFVQTLGDDSGDISIVDTLTKFIEESENRFVTVVADKKLDLPDTGNWEVALIIQGDVPEHSTDINFLHLLDASNPRYTG